MSSPSRVRGRASTAQFSTIFSTRDGLSINWHCNIVDYHPAIGGAKTSVAPLCMTLHIASILISALEIIELDFLLLRGSADSDKHARRHGGQSRSPNIPLSHTVSDMMAISVENRKFFPPRVFYAPAGGVTLGIGYPTRVKLQYCNNAVHCFCCVRSGIEGISCQNGTMQEVGRILQRVD